MNMWQRLLKYYSSCISVENAGEIVLSASKEGVDFLQVPAMKKEWVISGKEKLEFEGQEEKIRSFINGPQYTSRTPVSYFYGFPCHIKYDRQEIIQPILIFGIDLVETKTGHAFVLQSEKPRINSAFLTDKALLTSIEERKQIAEAVLVAWDDKKSREKNLKTILSTFAKLLPQEVSFSEDILDSGTIGLNMGHGILPVSVVFRNTGLPYTRGLEQELAKLRNKSSPNSVWRIILDRDAEVKEDNSEEMLEITELNDEQRNAIRSAFNNTLSVITGPPGTGKSQVVLNIIANALLHNETVLFGSKNHKAVDVVIERLLRLQSEPLILKYGKKEREVEFAERLLSAIERASSYDHQSLAQEVSKCKEELDDVRSEEREAQQSLFRILNRRNQISHLDKTLEDLEAKLPPSMLRNLSSYQKLEVGIEFYTSLASLDSLIKEIDEGPRFLSSILTLFGYTLKKRVLKTAKTLLPLVPITDTNLPLNSIHNCRELLTICLTLKKWVDNQTELLNLVLENKDEAEIGTLRERITKSKERAVEISIRYVDALMRRRLKSLSSDKRRDIADYLSIVRQLNTDVTGGNLAEELREARGKMFKSVVKAFPAMAVTNLSIRHALPLTPDIVDVVIIDEASQCDIASAIPLLYRAKRAVIVGDPNQIGHISNLNHEDDQLLQQQSDLSSADNQRFVYSINSLFDLARSVVGSGTKFIRLLEHYRSRAEIIGFSNKKFYGGELSVWTDYRRLRGTNHTNALVWHNVIGEVSRPPAGGAYNLNEVNAIVALIEEILSSIPAHNSSHSVSLGVVTPFREQANKIRVLVEEKIDATQLQNLDFIVDTVHGYQGDERDIMIFSPVVSRNIQQRSLLFLDRKLFNVAITRARTELHVVGDKTACAQFDIPHLSEFVKYVEELEPENENQHGGVFESPWEEVLYKALAKEGIQAIPQYSFHQYRLDLAILNSETQIDIEIDGEAWHRNIDGSRLLSDLKRDQHLTMHGWKVKRFWVYQLKNNLEQCVQEVKRML